MAEKFWEKWLPEKSFLEHHPHLRRFGQRLNHPSLWHMNQYSLPNAFAIGLFSAFMPIPFQMLLASFLAIYLRGNLPISVALVWITNPLTMPPIFYFAYSLGRFVMDLTPINWGNDFSWNAISQTFSQIWQPLLVGAMLLGLVSALLGSVLTRYLWRWHIGNKWKRRKKHRLTQLENACKPPSDK